MRSREVMLGCLLAAMCAGVHAEPLPISEFARRPEIDEVHISPDGRYLLYTTTRDGHAFVATLDRRGTKKPLPALQAGERNEVSWCRWVTAKRFVCGLRHAFAHRPEHPYARTRLAAVNADGTDAKIVFEYDSPQDALEDQVVNLRSPDEGWIQVRTFRSLVARVGTVPSDQRTRSEVVRLNVSSGTRESIALTSRTMPRYVDLIGDIGGQVLIADGIVGADRVYWVRFSDGSEWRELFRHDPLEAPPHPAPFALVPGTRNAYAVGRGRRHQALFQIDLSGSAEPRLIYEAPDADVREPIFAGDGELLGMRLDTERPSAHYLNRRNANGIAAVNRLLPDRFNEIIDVTADRKTYVIRSSSDVDAGTYYLLDASTGKGDLELLGSAYPNLDPANLARMQSFEINSDSGSSTRGFVSIPLGASEKHLPLIVMPDDGPNGRAEWRFSFLRHFLLSRGYAVAQLQLDETSTARNHSVVRKGLNDNAYSLVERAVRWATERGVADPRRVAVMGWGYGGYLALLGSERNPDMFRCAVAINAVADLTDQPGNHPTEPMIGHVESDSSRRANAPSKKTAASVLLIYGSHDTEVHPHQARYKSLPLSREGATYERVEIKQGTHELSDPGVRARMLEEVEKFLAAQLAVTE